MPARLSALSPVRAESRCIGRRETIRQVLSSRCVEDVFYALVSVNRGALYLGGHRADSPRQTRDSRV